MTLSTFDRLAAFYDGTIKADPTLIRQLICHYFSAFAVSPLNARICDAPGTGKTYTLMEIAATFPKENIWSMSYASPTSFFHTKGVAYTEEGSLLHDRLDAWRDSAFRLGVVE